MEKKQLSLSTLWSTHIQYVMQDRKRAMVFYEDMIQKPEYQEMNREIYDLMVIELYKFLGNRTITNIDNKYRITTEEDINEETRDEDRHVRIGAQLDGSAGIGPRELGVLQHNSLS